MAELVYAHDSKSCAERLVGSSPTSGTMKKRVNENKNLRAYILGVALGDGNLSNPNGRAVRLRITCDLKYEKLYKHIQNSIQELMPDNKVSLYFSKTYLNVSCYSNMWEEILGWNSDSGSKYKQQVKIPDWVLENEIYIKECLTGIIQTDGSIYKDRGYLMLNITSSIPTLAKSIIKAITNIGYKPNIQLHKDPKKIKYTIRISKNTQKFINDIDVWKK